MVTINCKTYGEIRNENNDPIPFPKFNTVSINNDEADRHIALCISAEESGRLIEPNNIVYANLTIEDASALVALLNRAIDDQVHWERYSDRDDED